MDLANARERLGTLVRTGEGIVFVADDQARVDAMTAIMVQRSAEIDVFEAQANRLLIRLRERPLRRRRQTSEP